ncbi:hypothetical protein BH09PAT2_BH09PAT2_01030 [soil metagenome]
MSIEDNVRKIVSPDPYTGDLSRLKGELGKMATTPEEVVLGRIARYIPDANSTAMRQAITLATMATLNGQADLGDDILRNIVNPYVYVTPETKGAHPRNYGMKTDANQRALMTSGKTVQTIEATRQLFETGALSPLDAIATAKGDAQHTIERVGQIGLSEQLRSIGLLTISAGTAWTMYEGGAISEASLIKATAAIAAAGLLEISRQSQSRKHLKEFKDKILPVVLQGYNEMAPQIPTMFDLSDRADLMEQVTHETPDETARVLQNIVIIPPTLVTHPVLRDKSLDTQNPADYHDFVSTTLYTSTGRLRKLSHVLDIGLGLEMVRNENSFAIKGEPPKNRLPIIGRDDLANVATIVETIGRQRLDGAKGLNRKMDTGALMQGTDAERKQWNTMNINADYLPLYVLYPQLQQLLFPDGSWPGKTNIAITAGVDDLIFHMGKGRNYAGNGIMAKTIQEYWRAFPTAREVDFEGTNKINGYIARAATKLLGDDTTESAIAKLPRATSIGINSLNPYGQLIASISAAAHYDTTNGNVGEGWLKEINKYKGTLIARGLKNPQDLFVALNTLSVETHIVKKGADLVRYYDHAAAEELRHAKPGREQDQWVQAETGVKLLKQGVNNVAKARREGVHTFMGMVTDKTHHMLTAQKQPDPHDQYASPVEQRPYELIYLTLSTIASEAPDLSKEIAPYIHNLFHYSGTFGSGSELDNGLMYVFIHLKRQLSGMPMTEDTQRILDAYETFIVKAGHHSFINLAREDNVGNHSQPETYVNNSISFLRDMLYTCDQAHHIEISETIVQKMQNLDVTQIMDREHWSEGQRSSKTRMTLTAVVRAAEVCREELRERQNSIKDKKEQNYIDLQSSVDNLTVEIQKFNATMKTKVSEAAVRQIRHSTPTTNGDSNHR